MAEKQVVNKVRICQRADGAYFSWNPKLDLMSEMRSGWLRKYEDGTEEIELDPASRRVLDSRTTSEREAMLLEQNADLRKQLAEAQGLVPPTRVNAAVVAETVIEPGESVIAALPELQELPEPPEIASLTDTPALDEEAIEVVAPKSLSPSRLRMMNKADLTAHVHSLAPGMEIPETMTKDQLVTLCLDLQAKAVPA